MLRFTRRHLAAGATLALAASTFPLATTSFAQSADETAVAKAVDGLGKAMLAADKAQLEALLADKLSYGHSAGRIETKAEFLDIVAGKKTIYKSITLTEPSITVAGDHAIVRHIFAVETEFRRQARDGEGRRDAGLGEGRRELEAAGASGLPARSLRPAFGQPRHHDVEAGVELAIRAELRRHPGDLDQPRNARGGQRPQCRPDRLPHATSRSGTLVRASLRNPGEETP